MKSIKQLISLLCFFGSYTRLVLIVICVLIAFILLLLPLVLRAQSIESVDLKQKRSDSGINHLEEADQEKRIGVTSNGQTTVSK